MSIEMAKKHISIVAYGKWTHVLRAKNSQKSGGKFEFSHEERCTVVHLPFTLMEIFFFALSMDIYYQSSECPNVTGRLDVANVGLRK